MSISSQKLELRYYKYKQILFKKNQTLSIILVYDVNYKLED